MKQQTDVTIGLEKSNDTKNQTADRCAILEDLRHATECIRELQHNHELDMPWVVRALWESSLMALRRVLANAQTMGPDSGGVNNPVARNKAKQVLPPDLHECFDQFYALANAVAHRKPMRGIRQISVKKREGADAIIESINAVPTPVELSSLRSILEHLSDYVVDN